MKSLFAKHFFFNLFAQVGNSTIVRNYNVVKIIVEF